VVVAPELNTIPKGFTFTTEQIIKADVVPFKAQRVDFGISTESGIYGIVFYDVNGNGKPDPADEFIARVRLILDNDVIINSDFEGTYLFKDVKEGSHTIAIDVNSLPINYLPQIKIKNTFHVAEGSTYIFHIPLTKTEKKAQ